MLAGSCGWAWGPCAPQVTGILGISCGLWYTSSFFFVAPLCMQPRIGYLPNNSNSALSHHLWPWEQYMHT